MKEDNIYISTLAFKGEKIEDIINIAKENNLSLEFSSDIPHMMDMEQIFLAAPILKIPHNYFPAPEIPFVLNLASSNSDIRKKSIEHCKNGLMLAKKANAPFYSAHAGFCFDPSPDELGKKFTFKSDINKDKNKHFFLQSVEDILKTADKLGIDFLVENNVIASFNLRNEDLNPLLCCDQEEINWLFTNITNNKLGLLLDTAHLKVSCQTLDISLHNELMAIQPFIRAIHHSDNNGLIDNNQPMNDDYWFLKFIGEFQNITHIIEVQKIENDTIHQQINLLKSYGC